MPDRASWWIGLLVLACSACARVEPEDLPDAWADAGPDGTTDATDPVVEAGPCVDGTCTSPPLNECEDAVHMRVYDSTGDCIDGTCVYGYRLTECAHGCVDGACVSSPCTDVDCTDPPGDHCVDSTTLRDYEGAGTCVDGTCSYPHTDVDCAETPDDGCVDDTTLRQYSGGGTCDALAAACDAPFMDTACPDWCLTDTCVECRSDTDCTGAEFCNGDHECEDPGCPPPIESCTTGSQDRRGCSGARIIGRTAAGTGGGVSISDDTCYASNRFDSSGSCWDAGADHSYRIYMRAGESMDVEVYADWGCVETSWDLTLKIFQNSGCTDTACTTRVFCEDYITSHTEHFTAPHDGWYIIVVDGTTAFDDEGDYDLDVTLTCIASDCEC
ncbi:MAG: hypothetical protein JRG91_04485 [Deltaproteobacteria bacterium]|nr:hypothetical protein [Deltaproteobacteria bacterium]